MRILDDVWTKLTSDFACSDTYGNRYYESRFKDYLGRHHRSVIYTSRSEPSIVPPLFHAWLHHLTDQLPPSGDSGFAWQKHRKPNATGTKMAYDPIASYARTKVSADYQSWQPKNE